VFEVLFFGGVSPQYQLRTTVQSNILFFSDLVDQDKARPKRRKDEKLKVKKSKAANVKNLNNPCDPRVEIHQALLRITLFSPSRVFLLKKC
jgi:hypothetical protein